MSRRRSQHGEGSVHKLNDPTRSKPWVAQVTLENGRRKQTYHATQKEATAAKRKMLYELEQGRLITTRQQTVESYLCEWLIAKRNELSEATVQYYREYIHWHLIPHIGHIKLTKLTHADIQAMYPKLRKHNKPTEPLHPNSIRHVHSVLTSALNDAVEQGKIAHNPCRFVKQPREQKANYVFLSFEEASRFIEVTRGSKYEAIMVMALATGMRQGELLALHWPDIDMEQKIVHVARSLAIRNPDGIGYQQKEKEPKSAASRRTVIIPPFALDVLRKHRVKQKEQRLATAQWADLDLVFPNDHGNYMRAAMLSKHIKRLLEQAGLPDMRFHDLRHSAASILLAMGVPIKVVQEILGHSSPRITLEVYGHVSAGMQAEAAEKINKALSRKEG